MHTYPKRVSLHGLESEIFKLVSEAATPEQWAEWLRVPLEHAAAHGNLDLFNILLGAGANGSAGWRGCHDRTLIDAAAVGGSEGVMSALLQAGAQPDINVVSVSSGRSALYSATLCDYEAVARCLIVAGADVNFEDPELRRSVLHEAIRGGHEQLVHDLVISGANLNTSYSESGDDDFFSLHVAAATGSVGMVSTLLLRGADKDALDNDGYTPLMWASYSGHLSIVETLLAAGADFNVRSSADHSYSPLDIAARGGHVEIIKAILGRGADVNAQDESGNTALRVAVKFDMVGAIHALTEAGADVELKDYRGRTYVSLAAYAAFSETLLSLLQHGANPTARDNIGDTALHKACCRKAHGMEATVDLLLRWGADETATNEAVNTPLQELDEVQVDGVNQCSNEEIERTRLLLSLAPVDRAWRRRCWLVMLRSRSEKARAVSNCDSGGGSGVVSRTSSGDDQGGDFQVATTDDGGEFNDSFVSGVVALLVGLQAEGVFRTIVGFL